jgi:hypothetical protein
MKERFREVDIVPNRSTGTVQYIPGAEESERLIIQEDLEETLLLENSYISQCLNPVIRHRNVFSRT